MTGSRPKRILVVEDDPASRELLVYLLERYAYEVQSAAEGSQALDLVRSSLPDLIISDILMSGIDGFELIRRLRADSLSAGIPVVLYSGAYQQQEAQQLLKTLGPVWGIEKPAD